MAIGYIKRVAGPFTGAGTTSLPFGFLVYKPQDVYVALAASETAEATNLEYGTDYTVALNADQETTPGGTVTLTTALLAGQVAAVGSALDYTQPTQLTNFSRFPPEIINDALDRIVILIQQLLEKLGRTVTLPVTSSQTPEELVESLQKAAESAEKVASAYAAQAGTSAAASAASAELAKAWATKTDGKVEGIDYSAKQYALNAKATADALPAKEQELEAKLTAHTDTQIARIKTEGTAQTNRVSSEGDKQLLRVDIEGDAQTDRIYRAGEAILNVNSLRCKAGTTTLSDNVSAGTEVALPEGVTYVVSANNLRLCLNGIVLYLGQQYTEVGTDFTESKKVKFSFGLKQGDVLQAWAVPIGGTKNNDTGVVTPDEAKKCNQETWVASAASSPVTLSLPNGMTYIVGKEHLRLSWNGVVLMTPYEYSEIGEFGASSSQVKLLFNLRTGDEVNAWTVPYAAGNSSET